MFKKLNFFNIKTDMYSISDIGEVKNNISGHTLSLSISGSGYYTVGLQMNDGSRKIFSIHVLVATAYMPNFLKLKMINHMDLDKLNCDIRNLEWCTQAYNNKHARDNHAVYKAPPTPKGKWGDGASTYGENNGMSKWSEPQVRLLCEAISKGLDYGQALEYAGLEVNQNNRFNVSHIARGHRWKRISDEYDMPYRKSNNSI